MVGMLLGMVLARLTAENVVALWVSFLLLTAFHMYGEFLCKGFIATMQLSPSATTCNTRLGVFVCSDLSFE